MKNQADYSKYECPFSHIEKECGHNLEGPEGFQDAFGVWCKCGFRGPVFCLDPVELKLAPKEKDEAPETIDNTSSPKFSYDELVSKLENKHGARKWVVEKWYVVRKVYDIMVENFGR